MPLRWRSPFPRWFSRRGNGDPPPVGPSGWGALRLPTFRWFLLGSLLSNIGNQMRTATVGWEVYDRTGDAWYLALVGLVMAGPVLMLALPAGVLADRVSRRTILLIAMSCLGLCGLGLAWASATEAPLWVIYLLLFATGVSRALGWPALSAYVTQLVPPVLFANAATWRSVAFQTAATAGPMLGGVLLAVTKSPAYVYLVDVGTTAIFIGCLLIVRPGPQKKTHRANSWKSVLDGVRFVRNQPLILSTITLDMVAVLFGGATALLPLYAKDILGVGEVGYGWLRAMPSLGGDCDGAAADDPLADPPHGNHAVRRRCHLRRGDDRLWRIAQLHTINRCAAHARGGRQYFGGYSLDTATSPHARRTPRPCGVGQRNLH